MDIVELNERCRFLCYTPGQHFSAHKDGCYIRPTTKGDAVNEKGNRLNQNLSPRKNQFWYNIMVEPTDL